MKPVPFAYHRPASVHQILDLLAEHGSDAAILAGGQSLVPLLNLRLVRLALVIDLAGAATDLVDRASHPAPGTAPGPDPLTVRLDPLVRQADVLAQPGLATALPLLALALPHVGHLQTRSRGTVCGSLAHGDPLAELALASLVAGATVELTSAAAGRRTVPLDGFLDRAFAPLRAPDELVTALLVDRPPPGAGHAFLEVAHGVTLATAAAQAVPLGGGRWELRLGVGLDRNRPLVVVAHTDDPTSAAADLADQLVAAADPLDDRHGPAPYRRHLARTLATRAVAQAHTLANRGPAQSASRGAVAGHQGLRGPGRSRSGATSAGRPAERLSAVPTPVGLVVAGDGEVDVEVTIDGRSHRGSCEARTSLADLLRDDAGVTSVRVGCEQGVCGSCTVLVNGVPARACLTLAPSVTGGEIVTAAGLLAAPSPSSWSAPGPVAGAARALADALQERFALQCGFCAPGLVVTAAAWLADLSPEPGDGGPVVNLDDAMVRQVLSGTICRCTGYDAMVRAVLAAGAALGGAVTDSRPDEGRSGGDAQAVG